MQRDALTPRSRELLSPEECLRAYESVMALRSHWTERSPDFPFYTLGAASYLDAAAGRFDAYSAKARAENPLLVRHFGWILDRLSSALADEVGASCEYDERLALPGFHIFLFHESFRRPLADIHFDLHYQLIRWPRESQLALSGPLAITLSIKLPARGAGMRLWPLFYEGRWGVANEEEKRRIARTDPVSHRYRAGSYVLHSGHQLHQIAPEPDLIETDERVTLQAHAIPVNGRYLLYW